MAFQLKRKFDVSLAKKDTVDVSDWTECAADLPYYKLTVCFGHNTFF